MTLRSRLREFFSLKSKIIVITDSTEAVSAFYKLRTKGARTIGVRLDVCPMEVFHKIHSFAFTAKDIMPKNVESTRKIKCARRIQIQHEASIFDIKISKRTTVVQLNQDGLLFPLHSVLSEHEFGSINIHISENGLRCFSGKIKLAKDVPFGSDGWYLVRVTYLRTPMSWEENLRDALSHKNTIPNSSLEDVIKRLKNAVEQSKVP